MKRLYIAPLLFAVLLLTACGSAREAESAMDAPAVPVQSEAAEATPRAIPVATPEAQVGSADAERIPEGEGEQEMTLTIGDVQVPVQWEDNDSALALRELASGDGLRVPMTMYGGFEQVGDIGTSLPRNDAQTTTSAGDIVLYAGDQLVIFYGSNSWAYTRLGHIELSQEEMTELLGRGDMTATITSEN